MTCPHCSTPLAKTEYKGIEVDSCSSCGGVWLDTHELDILEDSVFPDDEMKNTLITSKTESERNCPVCEKRMTQFQYRWEDLSLESCPGNHGFWLDKGEAADVQKFMQEFETGLEKKLDGESLWEAEKNKYTNPSLLDRLIFLIRG